MGADRRPYSIMPVPFFSQVASSVRKRLLDTFSARSNTTGSLGTATDGSRWDATSQTIQVTTGAAKATTIPNTGSSGNTYPIASVSMPTNNNEIKLAGTNEGSAVAVWVQSSSDWWLVGVDAEYNTIPGNTGYAYSQNAYTTNYAQTAYSYLSNTAYAYNANYKYNSYTTSSGGNLVGPVGGGTYTTTTYSKRYLGLYNNFNYQSTTESYTAPTYYYFNAVNYSTYYSTGVANYSQNSSTVYSTTGGGYYSIVGGGTYNTYSFTNATTYAYAQYLRISKSVAGTVSTVTSSIVSTAQTVGSLIVSILGNQITAKAYSDTGFVSQIGSDLVHTATGATVTARYGIALSPSAYQQSDIIGTSVQINRN